MKRLVSLGLCFTLSLVLVFGSLNSSSFTLPKTAFASDDADHTTGDSGGGDNTNHGGDNPGGDTGDQGNDHGDGSHGMPPPEDPSAATAGGGGSDDDDDESDDDNNDNDDDNDNDNPQIPKDAPPTSDALAVKKLECPTGQQVTLFSTNCSPVGQDGTQSSTSAATVCPTSHTPTFSGSQDGFSVTSTVWEAETGQQQDMQKSLLHMIQSPTTESKPANPANCLPSPNPPTADYEPPPSVLPYKGDEVKLIDSYNNPRTSGYKTTHFKGTGSFFTFKDGTVLTATNDIVDPKDPTKSKLHLKITPGSNTPLDRLGVTQVDLPSIDESFAKEVPPSSKPGTGGTFLHKITYNDGNAIIASQNGDQQFWDVYGPNNQLKSTTMADPATRITAVENKQDNSVTFHPQGANSYTVYPRAADGTQKTVTVTSEGQPVVTVRDANNNIIPPKQ